MLIETNFKFDNFYIFNSTRTCTRTSSLFHHRSIRSISPESTRHGPLRFQSDRYRLIELVQTLVDRLRLRHGVKRGSITRHEVRNTRIPISSRFVHGSRGLTALRWKNSRTNAKIARGLKNHRT